MSGIKRCEMILARQEQVLLDNREFIIKNLEGDDVIDELIQAQMIGNNAAQRIGLRTLSRRDKNTIIFEQLNTAGPGAVEKFCEILKRKGRQSFIARKLESC